MAFTRLLFLSMLFSLCGIQPTQAEETDQFTLPPGELFDLGPFASQRLYEVIAKVAAKTNSDIRMLAPRAEHSRIAASQLAARLDGSYIVDRVYESTGPGFPRWLRWGRALDHFKPLEFREIRPWKTIYWRVFSQSPLAIIGLTPTIKMFNHYFGTDKLGHFFMQGHTYYRMYSFFRAHGKSPQQARAAIVTYGKIIEQTYLGTLINGIYSNADLSSNYSGWKFYMNLMHSIKIGDRRLSPILVLRGNQWQFSKRVNKLTLLKPYLSDNLNEALNPSSYAFSRGQIRKLILVRCPEWIERRQITHQIIEAKLKETRRWRGEDYGHWLPANYAVTLDTCFGGK